MRTPETILKENGIQIEAFFKDADFEAVKQAIRQAQIEAIEAVVELLDDGFYETDDGDILFSIPTHQIEQLKNQVR